jgi:hypothetical protein
LLVRLLALVLVRCWGELGSASGKLIHESAMPLSLGSPFALRSTTHLEGIEARLNSVKISINRHASR